MDYIVGRGGLACELKHFERIEQVYRNTRNNNGEYDQRVLTTI